MPVRGNPQISFEVTVAQGTLKDVDDAIARLIEKYSKTQIPIEFTANGLDAIETRINAIKNTPIEINTKGLNDLIKRIDEVTVKASQILQHPAFGGTSDDGKTGNQDDSRKTITSANPQKTDDNGGKTSTHNPVPAPEPTKQGTDKPEAESKLKVNIDPSDLWGELKDISKDLKVDADVNIDTNKLTKSAKATGKKAGETMADAIAAVLDGGGGDERLSFTPYANEYTKWQNLMKDPVMKNLAKEYGDFGEKASKIFDKYSAAQNRYRKLAEQGKFLSAESYFKDDNGTIFSTDRLAEFDRDSKETLAVLKANIAEQKPIIEEQVQLRKLMDDSIKKGGARIKDSDPYKALSQRYDLLEDARTRVAKGILNDQGLIPAHTAIKQAYLDYNKTNKTNLEQQFDTNKIMRQMESLTSTYKKMSLDGIQKETQQLQNLWENNPKLRGTDEGKAVKYRINTLNKLTDELRKTREAGGAEDFDAAVANTQSYIKNVVKQKRYSSLNPDTLFEDNGEIMVAAEKRMRSAAKYTEVTGDNVTKTLERIKTDLANNADMYDSKEAKDVKKWANKLQVLQDAYDHNNSVDLYTAKIADKSNHIPIDVIDQAEKARSRMLATASDKNIGGTTSIDVLKAQQALLDKAIKANPMAAGTEEFKTLKDFSKEIGGFVDKYSDVSYGDKRYKDYQKALQEKGWLTGGLKSQVGAELEYFNKFVQDNPDFKGSMTVEKTSGLVNKLRKQISGYANAELTEEQRNAYVKASGYLDDIDQKIKSSGGSTSELAKAFSDAGQSMGGSIRDAKKSVEDFSSTVQGKLVKGTESYTKAEQSLKKVVSDASRSLKDYEVAATGDRSEDYKKISDVKGDAEKVLSSLKSGETRTDYIKQQTAELKASLAEHKQLIKDSGEGMSFDKYRKQVESQIKANEAFYKNNPLIHGTAEGEDLVTATDHMKKVSSAIQQASVSGQNLGDVFTGINKELGTTYRQTDFLKKMPTYFDAASQKADALGNKGAVSLERLNNIISKSESIGQSNLLTAEQKKDLYAGNNLAKAKELRDYALQNTSADLYEYINNKKWNTDFLDELANANIRVSDSLKKVKFKEAYDLGPDGQLSSIGKMRDILSKLLDNNVSLMGEDFYRDADKVRNVLSDIMKFSESNAPGTKQFQQKIEGLATLGFDTERVYKTISNLEASVNKSSFKGNGVSVDEITKASIEAQKLLDANQNAAGTEWYNNLKNFREQTEMVGNVWNGVSRDTKEYQQMMKAFGWSGDSFSKQQNRLFSGFKDLTQLSNLGGTTQNADLADLMNGYDKTVKKYQNVSLVNENDIDNLDKLTKNVARYEAASKQAEAQGRSIAEIFAEQNKADLDAGISQVDARKNLPEFLRDMKTTQRDFIESTEGQLLKGTSEYIKKGYVISGIQDEIDKSLSKWTKAKNSPKSGEAYARLGQLSLESQALQNDWASGQLLKTDYQNRLADIRTEFDGLSKTIKDNGDNTVSFSDKLSAAVSKFSEWYMASQLAMMGITKMKEAVRNVVDMDTAMTELKKVTNETGQTYKQFYTDAGVRAEKYGSTVTDVINATADYARLGLSLDEATAASDAAIVYKNVGDGLKDINEASESIISTMQAFNVPATKAMTIVDKFNEVGNSYAISSSGLGQSLIRSAAAMSAAGNTLDETIALATGANEIVQNPEKVGKYVPKRTVRCGVAFAT